MNSSILKIARFLVLLISINFAGCQTKANLARSLVNLKCADLGIPSELIVGEKEKISYQGKDFVLKIRYNFSLSYSKKLIQCISAYQCSQRQSDRLHECNRQKSIFRELIFGSDSCNIAEIDC